MRSILACLFATVASVAACESEPPARSPADQLRARASADFECDESTVHTKTLDARTRVAWGCGQKATYVEHCEVCTDRAASAVLKVAQIERCNCTWVLDSVRTQTRATTGSAP